MPLTPADVHNVAFKKPPIGKRGYDEEEVDAFLDEVERELARLIEENNELRAQVERGGGRPPAGPGADPRLAAELNELKMQLDRSQRDKAEAERAARSMSAELEAVRGGGGPVPPGAVLSQNSFYAGEVFAMYNKHKTTCLSVKPNKKKPRLITAPCQLDQAFALNSPMSFHWKPSNENNLAYLAIIYNGQEMCARHKWNGTYFFPCNDSCTKYSLGATNKNGQFQIRDATKGSKCMDAEFKSALRMKHCGKFRDQQWDKFHVAFMH